MDSRIYYTLRLPKAMSSNAFIKSINNQIGFILIFEIHRAFILEISNIKCIHVFNKQQHKSKHLIIAFTIGKKKLKWKFDIYWHIEQ